VIEPVTTPVITPTVEPGEPREPGPKPEPRSSLEADWIRPEEEPDETPRVLDIGSVTARAARDADFGDADLAQLIRDERAG